MHVVAKMHVSMLLYLGQASLCCCRYKIPTRTLLPRIVWRITFNTNGSLSMFDLKNAVRILCFALSFFVILLDVTYIFLCQLYKSSNFFYKKWTNIYLVEENVWFWQYILWNWCSDLLDLFLFCGNRRVVLFYFIYI